MKRIAAALGADVTFELSEGGPAVEPSALAATAALLQRRLESAGGRPTDPNWEMTRQVPFALETWDRLGVIADAVSVHGRRVARGQLAAMLVEAGLDRIAGDVETRPEALDAFLQARKKRPSQDKSRH